MAMPPPARLCKVFVVLSLIACSDSTPSPSISNNESLDSTVKNHVHSTNEATLYDGYSLYRQLMETKDAITEEVQDSLKDVESEGFKVIKNAIRVVLKTAISGFMNGFLPHVERVRRDTDSEERGYLDWIVYTLGALLGKQKCSDMLACRTGKFVQVRVPAAQLAIMVIESMIPETIKSWFNVVKKSVIDRSDTCIEEYICSLDDD